MNRPSDEIGNSEAFDEAPPVIKTPGDLYDACYRGVTTIGLAAIAGYGSRVAQLRAEHAHEPIPEIRQPRRKQHNRLYLAVLDRYPDLPFRRAYMRAFRDVAKQQEDCDVQCVRRMAWDDFCNSLEAIASSATDSVRLLTQADIAQKVQQTERWVRDRKTELGEPDDPHSGRKPDRWREDNEQVRSFIKKYGPLKCPSSGKQRA